MQTTASFVVIICLFMSSEALPCGRNGQVENGEKTGEIYENSENDTIVTTLTFEGPQENISYTLGGDLALYFKMDGAIVKVINGTWLDRDRVGLPVGNASTFIYGDITCFTNVTTYVTTNGTTNATTEEKNVTYDAEVKMYYINKEFPVIDSPSSFTINEYLAIGSTIMALSGDTGDNIGETLSYQINSQDPDGVFSITTNGTVKLEKDLDYYFNTEHKLSIGAQDDGPDVGGSTMSYSTSKSITITIADYDDLPPVFNICGGEAPPIYTTSIVTKETHSNLSIAPCQIQANDGDTGINDAVTYSMISGTNNFSNYFTIDPDTGQVNATNPVDEPMTFIIAVRAAQTSRPDDRYATIYLQITAYTRDDSKPKFANSSFNGQIIDDGSKVIFATDSNTGDLLQLLATDADDPDCIIAYALDPANTPFKITSDGYIFARNLFSARPISGPQSFNVTALNRDAAATSSNRESDMVTTVIEVILVTTQAATTLQPSTIQSSTVQTGTTELESTQTDATGPEGATIFTTQEVESHNSTAAFLPNVTSARVTNTTTKEDAAADITLSKVASTSTYSTTIETTKNASEKTTSAKPDDAIVLVTTLSPKMLLGFIICLSTALALAVLKIAHLMWEGKKRMVTARGRLHKRNPNDGNVAHIQEDSEVLDNFCRGPDHQSSIQISRMTDEVVPKLAEPVVASVVVAAAAASLRVPEIKLSYTGRPVEQETTYSKENEINTKAKAAQFNMDGAILSDINHNPDHEPQIQLDGIKEETTIKAGAAVLTSVAATETVAANLRRPTQKTVVNVRPHAVHWVHDTIHEGQTSKSHTVNSGGQEDTYVEEKELTAGTEDQTRPRGRAIEKLHTENSRTARFEENCRQDSTVSIGFNLQLSEEANKFTDELMLTSIATLTAAGAEASEKTQGTVVNVDARSVTVSNEIIREKEIMEDLIDTELINRDISFDNDINSRLQTDEELNTENNAS